MALAQPDRETLLGKLNFGVILCEGTLTSILLIVHSVPVCVCINRDKPKYFTYFTPYNWCAFLNVWP